MSVYCADLTDPRSRRSFNAQEAKDNGGVVERERGRAADVGAVYVLNTKQRFRNGYLQRSIAIRSLIILSTVPPLDELQRYKQVNLQPFAGRGLSAAALRVQTTNK